MSSLIRLGWLKKSFFKNALKIQVELCDKYHSQYNVGYKIEVLKKLLNEIDDVL